MKAAENQEAGNLQYQWNQSVESISGINQCLDALLHWLAKSEAGIVCLHRQHAGDLSPAQIKLADVAPRRRKRPALIG
jgi:hypothetical protein